MKYYMREIQYPKRRNMHRYGEKVQKETITEGVKKEGARRDPARRSSWKYYVIMSRKH